MTNIPRGQWVRALTAHPRKTITGLADELIRNCEMRHHSLPQSGLLLLRMTEDVMGEDFYLGEMPVASAWIELHFQDGRVAEGAARVMDDSDRLAVALAVCDATMANELDGSDRVAELIEQGMKERDQTDRTRAAMLAKTSVDFSLLTTEISNNED
ncbi:MAG: phosphonate C-P lyase system protein PhnG [Deltaproteobacteria bacterium]|nr:phosphonate C-P lyase system protein PhnG [Deltaproteobacteria bacterium]